MKHIRRAAKAYAAAAAVFLTAIVTYNVPIEPWILVMIVTVGAGFAVYALPEAK